MPSKSMVLRWLAQIQEFRDQYARARDAQADALADELLDVADDGRNDWMEKLDREGEQVGWMVNQEAINRSRLRVDTRKWIASKLKPKKYGDSSTMLLNGPGAEGQHKVEVTLKFA